MAELKTESWCWSKSWESVDLFHYSYDFHPFMLWSEIFSGWLAVRTQITKSQISLYNSSLNGPTFCLFSLFFIFTFPKLGSKNYNSDKVFLQ